MDVKKTRCAKHKHKPEAAVGRAKWKQLNFAANTEIPISVQKFIKLLTPIPRSEREWPGREGGTVL